MAGKKRAMDSADLSPSPKKKKIRHNSQPTPNPASQEIDFPRGGGSTFSALEYKTIRAEGINEANAELVFEDSKSVKKAKSKRRMREAEDKASKKRKVASEVKPSETTIRVEHLNYKRIVEGMKIFGQIIAIQPLALIVSLPCQLFGHIPITQVSTPLTKQLEAMDEQDEEDVEQGAEPMLRRTPELSEIFSVGQHVRTVVTAVRPVGTTTNSVIGLRRKLDDTERACQRIELSLIPEHVNSGVSKRDLVEGFVLSAAVQSVEDHGYILDLGVSSVSGFLSFKDAKNGRSPQGLSEGHILDVRVSKMSENGRTCNVTVDPKAVALSSLSHITSVTSVIPGALVHALVTAVLPSGFNVQILGFLDGTIDLFHLPTSGVAAQFKVGQKIKARILWDMITSEPRRFALSLLPHILELDIPRMKEKQAVQDAFPIGTIIEVVKVVRIEAERGIVVEVQDGILGYVHIRHVSDDHVPSLSHSSGRWKLETVHRARVIGFYAMDGILQLSLQESVLSQRFLQVGDVEVGELFKATVKKLTDSGLFVSISGNVDGVIWPNHYADINLKHPQKRFKEGTAIKCRILVVDPVRKRIVLTAKKTLVESELPILARLDDIKVGTLAHAVVFKVLEKGLLIEFYNNIRAYVPLQEIRGVGETPFADLGVAFPVGKPIKVRITHVEPDSSRVAASIRQAFERTTETKAADVHGVQVGEIVNGTVQAIHKEQIVLALQPSFITALLSVNNLANNRETTVAQLRATLTVGEHLDELVVLSRNPEKGLVIVSKRPKSKTKPGKENISTNAVEVGQLLSGHVTGYGRRGSSLHITGTLKGSLHPTDTCDDYSAGMPFPNVDTVVEGVVVKVDKSRKHVTLSTRQSRLHPTEKIVRDREISSAEDLKVGETVRGFVKNIADQGLFVSLGRALDARIQIRELFDEYVKDWKPRFEVNQIVQGKILSVEVTANKVEMSLRSGPAAHTTFTLGDFHEGQKVDATVKKKEKYGLFVEIKDTKISGLCHKSELSDHPEADVDRALQRFREGDPVKAIILTIDSGKQRISFGLKPSYFGDEDFEMPNAETSSNVEDAEPTEEEIENANATESEEDAEVINIDTEPVRIQQPSSRPPDVSEAPTLQLHGGFSWSEDAQDNTMKPVSDSDSETESDEAAPDFATKSKKKKKKKEIQYDLTEDMHTRQPESTMDFERLLLSSPNSSFLWIRFMSFQLQLSEIDKAREIGKRALNSIHFREEQEKLNVWIALLNLENKYGTDESLETVFKEAARHNDSKTIHLRLASIFDETGRHDRAVEQYQRTCKKFGASSKVWTLFEEHHFRHEDLESARLLLPRSLKSLEKRKHLKTINKFAQLEYKLGDPERGRTIFEGIVASHPKRWDLWSVYIDMEATKQSIQSIRTIFDRLLALKMTSHKAKAFFKKWLMLENRLGDDDGANAVKERAVEWTRRAAGDI